MKLLDIAKNLAHTYHARQYRRDGTTPYIFHVERVAARCAKYGEKAQIVAYCHDLIEDTDIPLSAFDEFDADIFEAVLLLTKKEEKGYSDYIAAVSKNELARIVKIEDILDNISDSPTQKQILKYAQALIVLLTVNRQ